jgi:alpha-tubulin suppressor-like RCC1 family protein
LGDGTKTNRFSPTQVLLGNGNIKKVDLGGSHTVILKNNGDVYGFGINTVNETFIHLRILNWEYFQKILKLITIMETDLFLHLLSIFIQE